MWTRVSSKKPQRDINSSAHGCAPCTSRRRKPAVVAARRRRCSEFCPEIRVNDFCVKTPLVLSHHFRHPHYIKRPLAKPRWTKHFEFCLLRTFFVPSAASVLSTPRSTSLEKSRPNGTSLGTILDPVVTYPESVELDKTRREGPHQVFKDLCDISYTYSNFKFGVSRTR